MKKSLLFFILTSFFIRLSAQITLNHTHLVTPGKKLIQATHVSSHAFASAGANQTWDFTDLSADMTDSIRFGVAGWYPGHENFPLANIAMVYYSDENEISFLDITPAAVTMYGNYSMTDTGNFSTKMNMRLITFPSTYNTSFSDVNIFDAFSFPLGFDPDSAGPIPFIDSVQIRIQYNTKSTIDGWGTMKTPLGDFAALKQTTQNISSPLIKMFSNGIGFDVPVSMLALFEGQIPEGDTSYTVNFWTNDATVGFPLVTYDYTNADNSASSVDWLTAKPQSSSIRSVQTSPIHVYPNPAADYIDVISPADNGSLTIMDMSGKILIEQAVERHSRVQIGHLSRGMYMLQLSDAVNGKLIGSKTISKVE